MRNGVLLTSTTNSFEAKVIVAHLRAEGLEPELRGAVDGPYPFLLGGMAEIGVWIPEDQLDDARLVLLATEVDNSVGADQAVATPSRWRRVEVVVAGMILGVFVALLLANALRVH